MLNNFFFLLNLIHVSTWSDVPIYWFRENPAVHFHRFPLRTASVWEAVHRQTSVIRRKEAKVMVLLRSAESRQDLLCLSLIEEQQCFYFLPCHWHALLHTLLCFCVSAEAFGLMIVTSVVLSKDVNTSTISPTQYLMLHTRKKCTSSSF